MIWFFGVLALLAYLLGVLTTARSRYGRERTSRIRESGAVLGAADPVAWFETQEKSSAVATAVLAALAWPLLLPMSGLGSACLRFITSGPPADSYERRLRARQRSERIATLERSLDLAPREQAAGCGD